MIVSFLNLSENLGRVVSLERQVSTHQGVEEHTQRPKIGLLTIATFEHLRSHVVWSACDGRQVSVVGCSFRETEINELHFVILGDHDIVGFDISMDNVLRMTMVDSIEKLFHVTCCSGLREGLVLLLCDLLEKLLS